MKNLVLVLLAAVFAWSSNAQAQIPSKNDCDTLVGKAEKLIAVLQNTKTKWQDKQGWQEAPDLAIQMDGCKTAAIIDHNLTMVNLYADEQKYLLLGAVDVLHAAATDLGSYSEKIYASYTDAVTKAEKCSRSRQYTPPPMPPPPITCTSLQSGNLTTATCQ